MELIDQLRAIATRAVEQADSLATEEATKNALVMPFINALGYNVFDPTEVVPEYTADVGIKKGEKVDYVIMRDGRPAILIECKTVGTKLDTSVMSQLFRYFTATDARFGVCTDGIRYLFFSDLDKPNRMDEKPFLEFDLLQIRPEVVEQLEKLSKDHYDQEAILASASELKYTGELKKALARQLDTPDEDFVRLMAGKVTKTRFTQAVREQFEVLVRDAFREFVRDKVQDRLQSALDGATSPVPTDETEAGGLADVEDEDPIVTSAEELEAFFIVKSILREQVQAERIVARDVRSYFGILLDDNNRKPLARLHFHSKTKHLGLFDNPEKREERVELKSLDDIYTYRARLVATPAFYDAQPEAQESAFDPEDAAEDTPP